jgi:hypothetical protein
MSEDHEGQALGLTRAERMEAAKVAILLADLERRFHKLFWPEGAPRHEDRQLPHTH